MEKPVHLRKPLWDYLLAKVNGVTPEEVSKHPAKHVYETQAYDRSELIYDTVIQLQDDVEYKITQESAAQLELEDAMVILKRLDGKPTGVPRATILEALKNNCEFDQMERGA